MIHFENPIAFIFLFSIPLIFILRKLGIFTKFYFPLTLTDWDGRTFEYKDSFAKFVSAFVHIFFFIAFTLLVTALANPIIRKQEKIFTSRGTDILFVLDISPSMAARDISVVNEQLTRLEAAKIGIKTLVSSQKGTSYGLVAMASESACLVPPTNDLNFFENRLESLSPGELGEGSAIGIGLSTAVYHLSSSKAPKKCIVLITDGENNAGSIHPQTAAAMAYDRDITIYSFGIGTKGTVPIEYTDTKTGKIRSGFYESNFNQEPLEKISLMAGGKYFGIETLSSLAEALNEVSRKEETNQSFHYRSTDRNCYEICIMLSLIFFFFAWFIKRIFLSEVF